MEQQYGRGSESEDMQSDPKEAGVEIGLEESMWKLRLGDATSGGEESYPERPDVAICTYYLRTGFCGYGSRCRFNHPRDRTSVVRTFKQAQGEYPERVGRPPCQYYMKTGTCKFGASCKFHHPRQGGGPHISVNYLGYPFRPEEKDCLYYMKMGQCKFGSTCKYHHPHPQPDNTQAPNASPLQYGVVSGLPPVPQGSYIPGYGPLLLSPGMVPFPGWTPYPAHLNPLASSYNFHQPEIAQLSPSVPGNIEMYQIAPSVIISRKEHSYPERPGQAGCQFYMKTGECKFGSSCRYDHPKEFITPEPSVFLSPMSLPLRPGVPLCTYYAQNGVCKFGPTCRFNHPMGATINYSPSALSLTDMLAAPYLVGSSSSSIELSPELTYGSSKGSILPKNVSSSNDQNSEALEVV